ncbi:hypothetical protein M5K25_021574 [Dendrobium thyrsiflorum]|uniref:DCD domain-containing protein n=1 Tax=Dendrobium thyrsiflorum TaxID=117978 RepID=A0ABD0UDD6_DENTH
MAEREEYVYRRRRTNENRCSMKHGKLNFVEKDYSNFAGAIFMSNRETKLECLRRKLFGLPLSKSKFLKQVKAGMILFLFEHEERKLYGVFEATSDGALNIIPDAFRSTGQSYPAQIIFKRIWMCKPLCEDEFRSAIEENYYSPNKFHFGLSYEQVINLIHLFYSRKINIKQYKGHGIPNKIIEKFENTAADDEVRLTETGTHFKCKSDEYSREGKREVRKQLALPQASLDPPMLYTRHVTTTSMQHTVANTGRGLNPVNLCPLSYPQNSHSETRNSQRCSICLSHDHIALHHFSIGKQPSTISDIEYKPLPLPSSCYMSNLDNMVAPYSMGVTDHSSLDTVACELSCNDPRIIPRAAIIQEDDAFTSLHVTNDLSLQTEVVQHDCLSRAAQPNQVFEFSDYRPLVEESQQKLVSREIQNSILENSEYIPSTILNSCIPSACKEISKYGYIADGYSDELKTYQRMEADHADSDLNRTSVFSRLSQYQNVCNRETPEPSSDEPSGELPLDQLLNILSTRRNLWSPMEVSKHSTEWDGNEQYGCTASTGLFNHSSGNPNKVTQLPAQPVDSSKINQYDRITKEEHVGFTSALDGDLSNDVVDEESFEIPFYNFRRRNTSQKHEVQDDSNKYGDVCSREVKLMNSKRRRIVRPSLHEEMHQDVKAEAEVKKSAQLNEETEVELSAQAILNSKNESKANVVDSFLDSIVPMLRAVRKYEPTGESLEQNHGTSVDGSLDYIPIG